jgi:cell division septation protein DedD
MGKAAFVLVVLVIAAGCNATGIGGPVLRDCTSTVSSSSAGTFQQAARDAAECNAENARRMREWTAAATAQAYGVTATAAAFSATTTAQAMPTATSTPEPTPTPTLTPEPTATAVVTPTPAPTSEPAITPEPQPTMTATAPATAGGSVNWSGLVVLVIGALVLLIGVGLMGRWIARRIDNG